MIGMKPLKFLRRQGCAIVPLVAFTYLGYKMLSVKSVDGPTAFILLVGTGILLRFSSIGQSPLTQIKPAARSAVAIEKLLPIRKTHYRYPGQSAATPNILGDSMDSPAIEPTMTTTRLAPSARERG